MPIDVLWLDEAKTMLSFHYVGAWTWQELDAAMVESEALHASVPHHVVGIIDLRESGVLPSGSLFGKGRETIGKRPANAHPTMVVVGASSVVQALGNIFNRLYGGRTGTSTVFVSTLEEALATAATLLHEH